MKYMREFPQVPSIRTSDKMEFVLSSLIYPRTSSMKGYHWFAYQENFIGYQTSRPMGQQARYLIDYVLEHDNLYSEEGIAFGI